MKTLNVHNETWARLQLIATPFRGSDLGTPDKVISMLLDHYEDEHPPPLEQAVRDALDEHSRRGVIGAATRLKLRELVDHEPPAARRERPGGAEATAKQAATMRQHATDTACPSCGRRLAIMDYADDDPGPRCRFCGYRPDRDAEPVRRLDG